PAARDRLHGRQDGRPRGRRGAAPDRRVTPALAGAVRARGLPYARHAREALAATALAGMLVAGFLLAAGAASGPSRFVLGSQFAHGYPRWLAGPLAGLAQPLTMRGFITLSLILYGLYLLVVTLAGAVRPRWAIAAVVAL